MFTAKVWDIQEEVITFAQVENCIKTKLSIINNGEEYSKVIRILEVHRMRS